MVRRRALNPTMLVWLPILGCLFYREVRDYGLQDFTPYTFKSKMMKNDLVPEQTESIYILAIGGFPANYAYLLR